MIHMAPAATRVEPVEGLAGGREVVVVGGRGEFGGCVSIERGVVLPACRGASAWSEVEERRAGVGDQGCLGAEEVPILVGAGAFVHGAGDLTAEAGGAIDGSHHIGDGDDGSS
jgi:hypothetical protein